MSRILLPSDSDLHRIFAGIASVGRFVFFAGLPGTGKSLLLQQMALMAEQAGRTVHLLQYDVARPPFETAENLLKYPEIDGFTHAAIRKAVGVWARASLKRWQQRYQDPAHLLVGEVPLVGNRLVELAQKHEDEVEEVLSSEQTVFLLPVPSLQVRGIIESARDDSMGRPRHDREMNDAPPNVLRALWREVAQVGFRLGLTDTEPEAEADYDPELYAAVYRHLLQHRRLQVLSVDTVLHPSGSAYDLAIGGSELAAEPDEVDQILGEIERKYTPESLAATVEHWYEMTMSDGRKPPDTE